MLKTNESDRRDIGGKFIEEKTWDEFRETGLLYFVNSFLQIFGWSIVAEYEKGFQKKVLLTLTRKSLNI